MIKKYTKNKMAPKIADFYRDLFGVMTIDQFGTVSTPMNHRCHWNAQSHTLNNGDNRVMPVFCYNRTNPSESAVHFVSVTTEGYFTRYHEVTLGYYGLNKYEYIPLEHHPIYVEHHTDMSELLMNYKRKVFDVCKLNKVQSFFGCVKRGYTF